MKAIAILDIDDELLEGHGDFAIEGELISFFTSKENALWRDGVKLASKTILMPFRKHILKAVGKDYVIYERNYLFENLDREYELNKSLKNWLEKRKEK